MKIKTWLLAGAAAGAFALSVAAPADAATTKHPKHKAVAAQSGLAAENQMLKDQLAAMNARLSALESSQQQVQAQAAQAQTTAQSVQEAQAATDDQILTIPDQVNLAIAAVPKPKKSWADNTTISGRMYYDLTSVEQKSNGAKVAPTGEGFDIKRFYLGVDHKFNDTYSANLTTDFQYSSALSATELYIKKAYLQAHYADALVVRVGSADLPWVPYAEDAYGYRFVENTLIDRDKYGTSADWGVHVLGTLANGLVNYQVSVIDGAGYKAPLRSKGMDVEGRVGVKYNGFQAAVGGYSGKLGKDIEGAAPTFHTAKRFDALAAYSNTKFRVGVEYFDATNWTAVTTAARDKADGVSAFGSYNLTDQFSVFGRYDWVKPNKDTAPARKDHYFNLGVNYEPVKVVDFALVYKRDAVDAGSLSTSNGTIGGSNKGTYDEVGLFGQVRW